MLKKEFFRSWHETVDKERNDFMRDKLGSLVGRKTKDGRTISLNEDTLLADGQPLLRLMFWLGGAMVIIMLRKKWLII